MPLNEHEQALFDEIDKTLRGFAESLDLAEKRTGIATEASVWPKVVLTFGTVTAVAWLARTLTRRSP